MTDFEKTYQNYNPRQTALDEARALLTAAAKAAMADGTLPEAELPAFIVEIPADVKNGDIASNIAMAGARTWRKAPKMIADALIAHLPDTGPAASSPRSRWPAPASSTCSSPPPSGPASCWVPAPTRSMAAPTTARVPSTTWSSSPPTPPAPCTWAMPAAALWVTVWPLSSTGPATT